MNPQLIDFKPDPPGELPKALASAAALARQLGVAGIEVHNAFDNGRRMVLVISAPPPGVFGAAKRRYPNGVGGVTTVYAAPHGGCQLEWQTHTTNVREEVR